MTIDIITMTDEEFAQLKTIQLKLVRTAQQKKDELKRKLEKNIKQAHRILKGNNLETSSLFESTRAELTEEYETEVEIIREQLLFNLSLHDPAVDEGGSQESGGDEAGYVVDYSLSYIDRYVAVRDYYLSIEDRDERMALYAADEVAKNYLASYYNTLFNYLAGVR